VWVEAIGPEIATEGMPSNRSWGSTCCGWVGCRLMHLCPQYFQVDVLIFLPNGHHRHLSFGLSLASRSPRDAAVLSQKMVAAEEVEMQYT